MMAMVADQLTFEIGSVPCPEQQGVKEVLHIVVTPLLAEDVSWVGGTLDVMEANTLLMPSSHALGGMRVRCVACGA